MAGKPLILRQNALQGSSLIVMMCQPPWWHGRIARVTYPCALKLAVQGGSAHGGSASGLII